MRSLVLALRADPVARVRPTARVAVFDLGKRRACRLLQSTGLRDVHLAEIRARISRLNTQVETAALQSADAVVGPEITDGDDEVGHRIGLGLQFTLLLHAAGDL